MPEAYARDYAPTLTPANYGYFARNLKPGMSKDQMRVAIQTAQGSKPEPFGYLTPSQIEYFVNNYEVVASSGDPSRQIKSGLDAVILRSVSSQELLVAIGGVGPTNSDYGELHLR